MDKTNLVLNNKPEFLLESSYKKQEYIVVQNSIISQSHDKIELSDVREIEDEKPLKPLNKFEMFERYTNDFLLHLVSSDGPGMLSILLNLGLQIPQFLGDMLVVFNSLNTGTGLVSIGADTRELIGTFKNPKATKKDKIVDVAHLIGGDLVSTAASSVPLVMPLTNPLALNFFIWGQVAGVVMDLYKFKYDISRKGQQSSKG